MIVLVPFTVNIAGEIRSSRVFPSFVCVCVCAFPFSTPENSELVGL